jgi:hypothetical protein
MRYQALWFSAVVLVFSGIAAAEPHRYRAQPERARAWVIDGNGLFLEQAGKSRRAIQLADWHWANWPYACAPDIAIGPRGEAVVTSNVLPVLWKIDPDTLAVSMHRLALDADTHKDVGFSSLVYSERHGAYFAVSELTGSLWRIDPLLRRAQKIPLSEPVYGACAASAVREERTSRLSRLCLHGEKGSWLVALAPDQRSAYVHAAGCSADPFAMIGGKR